MNLFPSFVNFKKKQKPIYLTNPIPESSNSSINKYALENSNKYKKRHALTLIKVNNNPKLITNSLILNDSKSHIILSTNENFKQKTSISPKNHSKHNKTVLSRYLDKANEKYNDNSQEDFNKTNINNQSNIFSNFLHFRHNNSLKGKDDTWSCGSIYDKIKHFLQIVSNNLFYNSVNCLFAILGLMFYDFKILMINPKYDFMFKIIHSLIWLFFVFEIIIKIISKDHYLGGILCMLDIASVISIYFETNNTLIHIAMYFYKDNLKQGIPNSKQIEIFIFITNILQIFKSSLVIKLYYFLLLITKKIEINIKLKEIFQMEDKRKELWRKKFQEKRVNTTSPNKTRKCSVVKNSPAISINLVNNIKQNQTNATMIKTKNTNNNIEEQTTTMVENSNNFSSPKRSNIYSPKLRRRTFENLVDSHEIALIQLSHNNILKQKKKIEEENESQISKIIAHHLSNEIILLILFILLVFPVFKDNTFIKRQDNSSFEFICEMINDQYALYGNFTELFKTTITKFLTSHQHKWITDIITINHTIYTFYINETLSHKQFRSNEQAYSLSSTGATYILYSIRNLIQTISIINIIRNCVLFSSLVIMSYLLVANTKENVINPLEVMINTVKCVSQDPVNFQSLEKINKSLIKSHLNLKFKYNRETYISSEIKTIQFAVIRISSLMAIGFGEAGGNILKDNMNSFGSLNPMIPGKKINAVFGFCLIRNFRKINEILQEKVIMFVNEIADIVHTNVNKFGGVCNKNIGESFLLIWKVLHENDNNYINTNCIHNHNEIIPTEEDRVFPHPRDDKSPRISKDASAASHNNYKQVKNIYSKEFLSAQNLVADCAVLSFLNIIKKITKSRSLNKLSQLPELNKLSKNSNFKIKMGFGLHIGWGIEGAIGSYYKIDCSYLSPNVNIAARLETATNIYNVDLLLSGNVFDVLSPTLQSKCRLIDCVTLKGSINPMKLYTIDVNKSINKGKFKNANTHNVTSKERRMKNEIKKNELFAEHKRTEMSMDKIYLERSKGLNELLKAPKNKTFLKCFTSGYDLYIKGEWEKAYHQLKQALFIDWNDGPTNSLINYIEQNNKKAPQDWKGYRNLLSKS